MLSTIIVLTIETVVLGVWKRSFALYQCICDRCLPGVEMSSVKYNVP